MGTVGYLLDTHTFLWAVHEEGSQLSGKVIDLLTAADAPLYVSSASAYEIIYKHRIGKLPEYDHVAVNFLEILTKSLMSCLLVCNMRSLPENLIGHIETHLTECWLHRQIPII